MELCGSIHAHDHGDYSVVSIFLSMAIGFSILRSGLQDFFSRGCLRTLFFSQPLWLSIMCRRILVAPSFLCWEISNIEMGFYLSLVWGCSLVKASMLGLLDLTIIDYPFFISMNFQWKVFLLARFF